MAQKSADWWDQEVDRLEVRAFAALYPHPFLLISPGSGSDPQTFRTRAMEDVARPVSDADDPLAFAAIPLLKGAGNPYEGRVIVGRARNCDVVLRHVSVSKFHADFRVISLDEAELTDRGSRNGTTLGAAQLLVSQPRLVRSGEHIAFGHVAAQFLSPDDFHAARR